MKQIYKPYTEWEDYKNGMFNLPDKKEEDYLINKAKEMLSNDELFFETSLKVLDSWVVSSDVNLTNVNQNRRSWIGQSACCFKFKVPELLTRVAWAQLNTETRDKANKVAEKIIRIYEERYRVLHQNLGEPML